jgi:hypothetical protein
MHASSRITALALVLISAVPLKLPAADAPGNATYSFSGGDGSSLNAAVIVHAADESAGLLAEHAWIREHWPNSKLGRQELLTKNNRPYDALTITDSSGKEHTLYFDISEYFGKL